MTSANQPTLNAINQQAVAALATSHLMGQPESPMAVMSPDGNQAPSDVSIQLESSFPGVSKSIIVEKSLILLCKL